MSNKQHDTALLEGYRGPYFPQSVTDLIDITDPRKRGFSQHVIDNALTAAQLRCRSTGPVITSDQYSWFAGIYLANNSVVILVPWAQDWERTDGSQSDRSPALYIGRRTSLVTADRLAAKFRDALIAYYASPKG